MKIIPMDQFLNPPTIWFALGLVLFLLEFAVPGLILFFFGVGAWVTAVISFFFDISINSQLLVFLATSILTVLLFRNWFKKLLWERRSSNDFVDDEFLGKTAVVEKTITPFENGKVAFRGTSWEAGSDVTIEAGEKVIITGNNSIILIVKPQTL
jgi:membrane protein implicated in regulation of membrane protease activity